MTPPQLHDYQKQAVQFLHDRKRAGLFMDMGLGKTCVTLTALKPEMLPALVTAPKRVAENVWEGEARLWRPDLRVVVAKGTPKQREAALQADADVIVIGRDNLADALPYAARFRTLVVDELSGFKNHASARSKTARKLAHAPGMDYVVGLTGTPMPQGLLDLWAQVFLLDKGERLGKNITGYRNRYFVAAKQLRTGVVTQWDLRPGAEKRIHTLLEDVAISMGTEGRLELPPVTFNRVDVPLPPAARQIYKRLKDDLVVQHELLGEVHSAANAAALTSKLSQVCAGFLYVDDAALREGLWEQIHTEKVKAVQEIVDGTGSPVLVAYRFKAELEMLKQGLGSQAHTLDEPDAVARWNAGELPVLLVHPASAGMGLNLQRGGHTLVWTSLTWSLEEFQQMNKRLARQGQQHPVMIHWLSCPFTVDPGIMLRLEGKSTVQQALLDHLDSPL